MISQVIKVGCSILAGITAGLFVLPITEWLTRSVTVSDILHEHEGDAN